MQGKTILLVALVAIGNVSGYYFPNGPPHRVERQLPGNLTHPEPKGLPRQRPEPIEMITRGNVPPTPKMDGDKPEPSLKDIELRLIPARKHANKQNQIQGRCQMNYALNAGECVTFQSQNYPNDYGNNIQSSVCFSSPSGTTMTAVCEEFNVEWERECRYDSLGFGLNGDPDSVQKYCGMGTLQTRPSSSNSLAVVFKSDHSNPSPNNRNPYAFKCKVTVSGDDSGNGGGASTTSAPPGDSNCNCGARNTRIVGGQVSGVNEFPWRCYLRTNRYSFFCGCSVISKNWILTAAHCTQAVMPLQNGDKLYAVVGDHDRSSSSETQSQQVEIAQHIDHPEYNDQTMDNDVSLLRISGALTLSRTISPVCLPFRFANDEFSGTTVSASGWGTTSQGGSVSNQLREVDLPVLTTQQCSRYYPGQITDNMICTYQPGKDTCQGDSGGSIDLLRDGKYYNIGVVSWGIGCARENNPGVYAKTTKYLQWIKQNTNNEQFCEA